MFDPNINDFVRFLQYAYLSLLVNCRVSSRCWDASVWDELDLMRTKD